MKRERLIVLAVFVLAMLGSSMPANAATFQGQICHTYYNPAGTKAEKLCASVGSNAAHDYWAQLNASNVSGKAEAYSNQVIRVRFWSTDDGTHYCQGNDDQGCGPEGGGEVSNVTYLDIPYVSYTQHYGPNQHRCLAHAYVLVIIFWESTLQIQTQAEFNSGVVDTGPYCD